VTGTIIVVLLIILVWLIGQTVLLVMLWGQQQRYRARADLIGRLIGVPAESDGSQDELPVIRALRDKDGPANASVSLEGPAPTEAARAPEDEAGNPLPELTFPPPLRRTPPVPSAREPLPPAEAAVPERQISSGFSSPTSTGAGAGTALDRLGSEGDGDRGGPGLPAGSVLPDFELTTIDGESFRRSMLMGRKSVMVFLATDSPGAAAVMESIRSPQVRKRSLPELVLVVDGGVVTSSLRRWLGKLHKRVTILVQEETELAAVLRVPGTPAAYVLDGDCRTHGPLRAGARAVLEALGISTAQMTATARRSANMAPHALVTQRSFSGLPVGSAAPDVALTLLDGGVWECPPERSCLVIFWDPDCPPCQAMKADLIRHGSRWSGFERIMICRDARPEDPSLRELGNVLPVSIQRGFDVAREFQVLEAPAAVAIGPDGTIARPAAIGAAAVLSLASEMHQRDRRAPSSRHGSIDA
jgi:hypothetical protein